MMMQASHVAAYLRTGKGARPRGNDHEYATNSAYATKEGMVMLGASNLRQQRRLWNALGRPEMAKEINRARIADREREAAMLRDILATRTADEWESFFQSRHVPAARVRTMPEA